MARDSMLLRSGSAALGVAHLLFARRAVIIATTRLELRRRYSGSLLGLSWAVLYPLLFLGIYLFVFLVLFGVRFPGYGDLDYALYVLSGLVPYLALIESVTTASRSIRQNVQLIRNVVLPIELIPLRCVAVAMVGQLVGLVLVLALAAVAGSASINWAWLPVLLALQFLLCAGIALLVAPLGAALADTEQAAQLVLLLLLFASPIAFARDMVPDAARILVDANPVYYLIESFRGSIIAEHPVNPHVPAVFAALALGAFVLGSAVFARAKSILADHV